MEFWEKFNDLTLQCMEFWEKYNEFGYFMEFWERSNDLAVQCMEFWGKTNDNSSVYRVLRNIQWFGSFVYGDLRKIQ